jgi:hypothetical protein
LGKEKMTEPLGREEFLRISRGDDPRKNSLWNGMPRMTTPPQTAIRPMADEGQLFEFLFPYPINIFDDAEWPALLIKRGDLHVHLVKPVSRTVSPKEVVAAGNEVPDFFSTDFPAIVLRTAPRYPVRHGEVFAIIREALQWIRVLSRQYWIGTGTAGVAAAYRGSAFKVEPPMIRQLNYAGYGQAVQVRSLKLDSWQQVGACVASQIPVPPAESIFCDALSSFASGDPVRCVLELGISAEIEITNLLDDVATAKPGDVAAKRYLQLRLRHKDYFWKKVSLFPREFGLDDPLTYSVPSMPTNWVELVQQLYGFRNKAAHEGRCLVEDKTSGTIRTLKAGELQSFIFAGEVLFDWARRQRIALGFGNVATPRRIDQIMSIIGGIDEGGGFVLDAGEASAEVAGC